MSSRRTPGVVFVKRQRSYCDPANQSTCTPSPSTSSTSAPPSINATTFGEGSTATSSAAQTSTTTSAQSASPVVDATSSPTSNAGTIAGCVIGGVVFLVLVVLGILLYLRARKRKRTPPSSEFMNSLKAGATPVLRLDSGAEYTPTLTEKTAAYTHNPSAVPPPLMQNPYYTGPPMQNMKFPDDMMEMTDVPSGRPSVERPLHPQRFSSQQEANDSFVAQHHPSTSIGSRRELWWSETEIASGELSPVHQSSPRADSVLQFAPHTSLTDSPTHPSYSSHSPTSLQPLRRQPDLESTGHV